MAIKSLARTFARLVAAHAVDDPSLVMLPETRAEAQAARSIKYFTGKPCTKGHVARRSTSEARCIACLNEWASYYATTPGGQATQAKSHAKWIAQPHNLAADRARQRQYMKSYYLDNKPAFRAQEAIRRATEFSATPPWLSMEQRAAMRTIYEDAARLTKAEGRPHHVDHIIPILARCTITGERIACGLHVPWNLQVLGGVENISKGARLDVASEEASHFQWLVDRGLASTRAERVSAAA